MVHPISYTSLMWSLFMRLWMKYKKYFKIFSKINLKGKWLTNTTMPLKRIKRIKGNLELDWK